MPNHVTSEMTLTFDTAKDKALFKSDIEADENICNHALPVVYDGNISTITFRDGTKESGDQTKMSGLPAGQDHWWGTKWGTYQVNIMDESNEVLVISFETAWGTMSESCLLAIVDHYNLEDLQYLAIDEGMDWCTSMHLALGEISTFMLDGDHFPTKREWQLAVNARWGMDIIDLEWWDQMEAEEEAERIAEEQTKAKIFEVDPERKGVTTDEFNELFRKHDGVPT